MAGAQLLDPFRAFRFNVEIGSNKLGSFASASVSDVSIETIPYREGMDPLYHRHVSGLVSYSSVSLTKGLSVSTELYDWINLTAQLGSGGVGVKKHVSLVLMDPSGTKTVAQWDLINAWPSNFQTSGMDASSSQVMIETLELRIEYMTRVSVPSS
jgi:phage tail-like protein